MRKAAVSTLRRLLTKRKQLTELVELAVITTEDQTFRGLGLIPEQISTDSFLELRLTHLIGQTTEATASIDGIVYIPVSKILFIQKLSAVPNDNLTTRISAHENYQSG